MKLIIKYEVTVYGCQDVYGGQDVFLETITLPLLARSAELFLSEFKQSCEKAFHEKKLTFKVGNYQFNTNDFIFKTTVQGKVVPEYRQWPTVISIDKWFDEAEECGDLIIGETQ